MVVHKVEPRDHRQLVRPLFLVFQAQFRHVLHGLGLVVELDGHEDMVAVEDTVGLPEFFQVVTCGEGKVVAE